MRSTPWCFCPLPCVSHASRSASMLSPSAQHRRGNVEVEGKGIETVEEKEGKSQRNDKGKQTEGTSRKKNVGRVKWSETECMLISSTQHTARDWGRKREAARVGERGAAEPMSFYPFLQPEHWDIPISNNTREDNPLLSRQFYSKKCSQQHLFLLLWSSQRQYASHYMCTRSSKSVHVHYPKVCACALSQAWPAFRSVVLSLIWKCAWDLWMNCWGRFCNKFWVNKPFKQRVVYKLIFH